MSCISNIIITANFVSVNDNEFIHPKLQKANIDDATQFCCVSPEEVEWYFSKTGSREDERMLSKGDNTLSIRPVDLSHEGFYICYGLNPTTKTHYMAIARLKVYGELFISQLV